MENCVDTRIYGLHCMTVYISLVGVFMTLYLSEPLVSDFWYRIFFSEAQLSRDVALNHWLVTTVYLLYVFVWKWHCPLTLLHTGQLSKRKHNHLINTALETLLFKKSYSATVHFPSFTYPHVWMFLFFLLLVSHYYGMLSHYVKLFKQALQRTLVLLLKHFYILHCKCDCFYLWLGVLLGERAVCIIFNFNIIWQ